MPKRRSGKSTETRPEKLLSPTDALELIVQCVCEKYGLRYQAEYRFHAKRRWRFDFAIPDIKLAIEHEGGIWIYGRHVRGKGYIGDLEKYNAATLLGWSILRYHRGSIYDGTALSEIESAVQAKMLPARGSRESDGEHL